MTEESSRDLCRGRHRGDWHLSRRIAFLQRRTWHYRVCSNCAADPKRQIHYMENDLLRILRLQPGGVQRGQEVAQDRESALCLQSARIVPERRPGRQRARLVGHHHRCCPYERIISFSEIEDGETFGNRVGALRHARAL